MKLKLSIFFCIFILFIFVSCGIGEEATTFPITEVETDTNAVETDSCLQSDAHSTQEGNELDVTNTAEDHNQEQALFTGKYSRMPKLEGFTDRLPNELKVYRSRLNDNEKRAYDLLLPYALTATDCSIDLKDLEKNGLTENDLFTGNYAINQDYPETRLYWLLEYKDLSAPLVQPDGSVDMVFQSIGSSFIGIGAQNDQNEIISYIDDLMNEADEIISQMPSGLSVKERYLWIANILCDMTLYTSNADNYEASYAVGPIQKGEATAQGYAQAYQLLCQKADLWCILCNGGEHVWNVIMLEDGSTYYMDLTWQDDASKKNDYYFMSYEKCIANGYTVGGGEWIADGKD